MSQRVPLNAYNYFVRINVARTAKSLSLLDLPPAVPTFKPNQRLRRKAPERHSFLAWLATN